MAARKNNNDDILLIRFSALGDVAMTIPAVYDLCRSFPQRKVIFLTRDRWKPMFVEAPANLIVEGVNLNDFKGIGGMRRLARQMREKHNIGTVVDLHDVLRTKLLRLFLKNHKTTVKVIDKGRREKKRLVAKGAEAYLAGGGKTIASTHDRYRTAIEDAVGSISRTFTTLYSASKIKPTPIQKIGIAPFAAHVGKIYPEDKMQQVIDKLAEKGCEIYLFGAGEKESSLIEKWRQGRNNIINMAEAKKGLESELRLMSELDVMLTMDSGNMHLAAIAGTPRVVSVWGATHPAAGFLPPGVDANDALGADMPCRPCSVYGNKPCRYNDYRCLNSISPLLIVNRILNT